MSEVAWVDRPGRWQGKPWVWPVLQGVPVPKKGRRRTAELAKGPRGIKATVGSLQVGDAMFVRGVLVTSPTALGLPQHMREYIAAFGYEVRWRTVGPGVVMVWRTA